jgi:prepilin-type processing-associated H-X9-DG protein
MRQVVLACHQFEQVEGRLPPAPRPKPYQAPSWLAQILPYVGEQPLADLAKSECERSPDPLAVPRHRPLEMVVKAFVCPADGRLSSPHTGPDGVTAAFTSYLTVMGSGRRFDDAAMGMNGKPIIGIPDGTSQTVMIGERPPRDRFDLGWWYYSPPTNAAVFGGTQLLLVGGAGEPGCAGQAIPLPNGATKFEMRFGPGRLDNPCDVWHFWSLHPGGGNFGLADGSVRFFRYEAAETLIAMGSRNGGESVAVPD